MTPIEIIDQMIEELPEDLSWNIDKCVEITLKNVRERIMNECTVRLSDGDNTYDIPYSLADEFNIYLQDEVPEEETDEWYDWCDDFDSKYSKYKV